MNKYIKLIIGIAIFLVFFTLGLVIYFYFILQNGLPDYNGKHYTNNLKSEVDIYRDSYAIPFIIAQNEIDATYSIGFLHAQERLFQMDIFRRSGQGRLSEVFGNKTLAYDKMFRTLGLARLAKSHYLQLSEESKNILKAYSNGVNDYLRNYKNKIGIEFNILNYEPELWKPEDCLLIGKLFAWELNISWWVDFTLINVIQKVGLEKTNELFYGKINIDDKIEKIKKFSLKSDLLKIDKEYRKFINFEGTQFGSNNWVVNSKKSISSAPIIANDPHLSLTIPSRWYMVSVNLPDNNCTGFTVPGLPSIIIGRNNNIAWAVTNLMADDSDFLIEEINDANNKYKRYDKWKEIKIIIDTVKVKNSEPIIYEIKKTDKGPIISDIHNFSNEGKNNLHLSMQWTAFEFSDDIKAFHLLNKAKEWNDFNYALSYYSSPGQNFIYADIEDNIGYACAAKLPIRKSNQVSLLPSANNELNNWDKMINYELLPKFFNPTNNFIATANNNVQKNYQFYISNIWEPESRIQRINELLKYKKKHSVEDFMSYQNDKKSNYAYELKKYILEAFHNTKISDENLNNALDMLKNWSGNMEKNNPVSAIYEIFFNKFIENIFLDELGPELFNEFKFTKNLVHQSVKYIIENPYNIWFNNVNTSTIENRNQIIRKSFTSALDFLEKEFGSKIIEWQWGKLHKINIKHILSGNNSFIDKFINLGPFEIGGNGTSLFNTEYLNDSSYDAIIGQSVKFIYDFSEKENFYYILPTGQSGHPMSKHYNDMTTKWIQEEYNIFIINKDFVKSSNFNRFQLRKK